MMKKILACALAMAMLLGTCAYAEGMTAELLQAAEQLFYQTTNVTVTAEAEFRYDGEWFKTLHGSYKQDGFNSYLSWMLDTPKADGSVYTGGYTVLGLYDTAYANDTYSGNYYYTVSCAPAQTLFTMNLQQRKAIDAASAVLAAAEDVFHVYSLEQSAEDANTVTLKMGDLPDIADAALWYLAVDTLWENYYMSLWNESESDPYEYVSVWYEDWNAIAAEKYKILYGEDMPEDLSDEVAYGRYCVAANAVYQMESEIMAQYEKGYVYILADGTHEWYETQEECMRRAGEVYVQCDDYYASLSTFYEKTYGVPLTNEMWRVLMYSPNEDVQAAISELYSAFEQYYIDAARAENPDVVQVVVYPDGTFRALDKVPVYTYGTVTQTIMTTVDMVSVQSVEADIVRDDEGRITAVNGTAVFTVTDIYGTDHALEITLAFTAADYDKTEVEDTFDPQKYGLVSYEEFVESIETEGTDDSLDWDEFVKNAPETIEFMGETYETNIKDYAEN